MAHRGGAAGAAELRGRPRPRRRQISESSYLLAIMILPYRDGEVNSELTKRIRPVPGVAPRLLGETDPASGMGPPGSGATARATPGPVGPTAAQGPQMD